MIQTAALSQKKSNWSWESKKFVFACIRDKINILDCRWHHVAFKHAEKKMELYLDGEEIAYNYTVAPPVEDTGTQSDSRFDLNSH